MNWFLYLIECDDGSIYTGIAVDVAARYAAHANGTGARYTRMHPPRRLLASIAYVDRSTASKAEYEVKQMTAREKALFAEQHAPDQETMDTAHAQSRLRISSKVSIPVSEVELHAMRAQGAGGQNVNKVSSAIHLRFDIAASSLPDFYKQRLLALNDQRLTKDGVIVMKSQEHRSQELNRATGLQRLQELIQSVAIDPIPRKPTKPSRGEKQKRLETKGKRGEIKATRAKVVE
jgi:ribosome-associated protein